MKKRSKYLMFALLYFSQGAIMSFFTALNALYLQSFGVDMGKIGIIGTIAMIPFVIKIFLGMLSDKINMLGFGHRKPYIVLGLLIQSLCLVIAPAINPGASYAMYAFLALIMMTGMALYDTCTDGLALDTTPKEEEGIIQGYMVGGRAAGMVVISSVLGLVVEKISWTAGFMLLAILTLLPLPLVLGIREKDRKTGTRFEWAAFKCFKEKSVISLGVLGALYSLIIYGANQLVNPFLVERFSIRLQTAGYVATFLGLGIVVGGFIGGKITDLIGQKKSVQFAIIASFLAILILPLMFSQWIIWILVFVFGLAFGFYETVYFAISMRITDGRIAATMFSILMAVANIGTGIGLGLTGFFSDRFGFPMTFIALAVINVLALPLLKPIFDSAKKNSKLAKV